MQKHDEVYVTDHAVLRYLERVLGFDIDGVRRHIEDICRPAVAIKAASLRSEGFKFEFVDNRVVTVTPDSAMPSRISRERSQAKARAGA